MTHLACMRRYDWLQHHDCNAYKTQKTSDEERIYKNVLECISFFFVAICTHTQFIKCMHTCSLIKVFILLNSICTHHNYRQSFRFADIVANRLCAETGWFVCLFGFFFHHLMGILATIKIDAYVNNSFNLSFLIGRFFAQFTIHVHDLTRILMAISFLIIVIIIELSALTKSTA